MSVLDNTPFSNNLSYNTDMVLPYIEFLFLYCASALMQKHNVNKNSAIFISIKIIL